MENPLGAGAMWTRSVIPVAPAVFPLLEQVCVHGLTAGLSDPQGSLVLSSQAVPHEQGGRPGPPGPAGEVEAKVGWGALLISSLGRC